MGHDMMRNPLPRGRINANDVAKTNHNPIFSRLAGLHGLLAADLLSHARQGILDLAFLERAEVVVDRGDFLRNQSQQTILYRLSSKDSENSQEATPAECSSPCARTA